MVPTTPHLVRLLPWSSKSADSETQCGSFPWPSWPCAVFLLRPCWRVRARSRGSPGCGTWRGRFIAGGQAITKGASIPTWRLVWPSPGFCIASRLFKAQRPFSSTSLLSSSVSSPCSSRIWTSPPCSVPVPSWSALSSSLCRLGH